MISAILGVATTLLGGGVVGLSIYMLRTFGRMNKHLEKLQEQLREASANAMQLSARASSLAQLNEDLKKTLDAQVAQVAAEAASRKAAEKQRDELLEIAFKGLDPAAVAAKINEELKNLTKLGKP